MRILLFDNYWPPEIGAASHLYYDLGCALVARGHCVTVLTGFPRYNITEEPLEYRGKLAMWEEQEGMCVRRVRTFHLPQYIPVARGLDHFLLSLIYALAGLFLPRPDVILLYSPPLPIALAAGFLGRCHRCPFVLNVQDIFPQSAIDLGVLKKPFLVRFFEWLERRIYRRADHITVHSEGNRRNVLAKLPPGTESKVSVVHNWIDTTFVRPGPRSNGFRREWDVNDKFTVSFAGTMGYSQDVDTILAAADLLRAQPDILFLLVGDGVLLPHLKEMATRLALPNVCWVPMQSREHYPAILNASDTSLVTLRHEVGTPTVPSKLLSIMAAGRPVLMGVPLNGDAPKIVADAHCGLCVPPGRPDELAAAILELYRNRALAARLGRNGRAYIEQHFSVAAAAAIYESLFTKLISGQASASVSSNGGVKSRPIHVRETSQGKHP